MVAASGLPFRMPGLREVQGLWVELVLQGHWDWLVHRQPGEWVAEATKTVHSQVWVVLGDPRSRSAQQKPSLRPLASSSTRSQARRCSKRTCLLWIDLDRCLLSFALSDQVSSRAPTAFIFKCFLLKWILWKRSWKRLREPKEPSLPESQSLS